MGKTESQRLCVTEAPTQRECALLQRGGAREKSAQSWNQRRAPGQSDSAQALLSVGEVGFLQRIKQYRKKKTWGKLSRVELEVRTTGSQSLNSLKLQG